MVHGPHIRRFGCLLCLNGLPPSQSLVSTFLPLPADSRTAFLYGALTCLSISMFAMDWVLPPELTDELLQVAVILLTLFLPGQRSTWVLGGLTTLFVGLGYATHVDTAKPSGLLLNRGLILAGLWLAVAVVLRYKRVRRARRESEARAEAVLDAADDGIITLAADGTIESFNPAAEEIFGYSADEIAGTSAERLLAPPHQHVVQNRLRDADPERIHVTLSSAAEYLLLRAEA